MKVKLRSMLLAALISGFLSAPAPAAQPLNQGEAFFKAGQTALMQDEWYLALILWEDIPADSELYPVVHEQLDELRETIEEEGDDFDELLSGKALEKADAEARQGHLVAAIYYLDKVNPGSSYAQAAASMRAQWRRQLAQAGTNFDAELNSYAQAYEEALRIWERDNYYESLRRLRRIKSDSPYYYRARAILRYVRTQLADLPLDIRQDEPGDDSDNRADHWMRAQRSFALGLQGRIGLPLGDSPAGGGGLGLSWYPIPQAAVHLEANIFPLNGSMAGFIPLTGRYILPLDTSWDLFFGAGGYWSGGPNVSVFGVMAEAGTTWQFHPHWALELNADFGLPLSPGAQTLGGRLGVLTTF
ncbi:MAG TPA: hypothetical protein V6D23_28090 [Candidatus Obscuribacterales bacterium]